MKKIISIILILISCNLCIIAQGSEELVKKGWNELIKDNDTTALRFFYDAYFFSKKNNDVKNEANALLHLGIASYGSSLSNGLKYTNSALQAYAKIEKDYPTLAQLGRSKCLILMATIKARASKPIEAMQLCKEALSISIALKDTSSSIGLAYNLLGSINIKLNKIDTADDYFQKALAIRLKHGEMTYLPGSFIKVGDIALRKKQFDQSLQFYQKGLDIADSMQNKQAKILCLMGLSKWYFQHQKNYFVADSILLSAKAMAIKISDKSFLVQVLEEIKNQKKQTGNFTDALTMEEEILKLNASLNDIEKEHITKSLEVQFGLMEKERQLNIIKKEQAITKLTNYLLYVALAFITFIALGFILFLKRINKRDKQLLETKAALLTAVNTQKKLKEQQLQNELEFKESQLSALTLQMIQKNELMQELKEKLEHTHNATIDATVSKIISKGLIQDKEWTDFNTHFESINKNFYSRIKQTFPDISPNELKICALIKMNLSIKEMASILNISPDSVKTARYRLRKKLNLNTEDNLTDFILSLQ